MALTEAPQNTIRDGAMKCKHCQYWNRAKRASWHDIEGSTSVLVEHAQCRRYAPARGDRKGLGLPESVWPHVNATDWCGDFVPATVPRS